MAAFTNDPDGGNPAGVWVGQVLPEPAEMQRIAADVGYSETAFLVPAPGEADHWVTRYYSPGMEVSFCGHATIAAAVVLASRQGNGTYHLRTTVGDVPVKVQGPPGAAEATLTSVTPDNKECPPELLDQILTACGWSSDQLDPAIRPALAYAGAWHLILALQSRSTLAGLDYDFEAVRSSMTDHGLTTLQIVWREDALTFHARNPFPVGGVVEDPATGAAAAALGGYLREVTGVGTPADITIHQGHDMGRPSLLRVHIPDAGGIYVTGQAVPIATG